MTTPIPSYMQAAVINHPALDDMLAAFLLAAEDSHNNGSTDYSIIKLRAIVLFREMYPGEKWSLLWCKALLESSLNQ